MGTETFPDRVRLAIRRLGIAGHRGEGYGAVDKIMGKAWGYTSGVLTRSPDPRLSSVVLLARALKVRIEWLATGEGPMELGVPAGAPTNDTLPGWSENAASVKGVPRYAVERVGRLPILLTPEGGASVEFIRSLAGFWLSWSQDADEAARVEAERIRRGEDSASE